MPKLDSYLAREFAQAIFATLVVLMMVSVGGLFADVLGDIARGRVPAGLMLAQLGLQVINYLPLILPLALMIGLLIGVGRLYRDAEMPVLASIGVGPRRLLRPLLLVVGPFVLVVAVCSLWAGPWAMRYSARMIQEGNRSLLVAGLEAGRFTELPGGNSIVYIGAMSNDATRMHRVFVYRESDGRMDVTTAQTGNLALVGDNERFMRLDEGFRVEGPLDTGKDFRLIRYASNELRLPSSDSAQDANDPVLLPTTALFGDPRPEANAQLHWRLAPPLLALAFSLLAIPLGRSSPRQARYGRMMLGFLSYLVGMNLMTIGTGWLAAGKLPAWLGLWWLTLPLLALGAWLYANDGNMKRPRFFK